MGVRVVTDSACDLPDDLIERDGIEVVPLTIRFGNEELIDRKELSTDEFWRRLADSDVLPETSAPSAGAFEAGVPAPDRATARPASSASTSPPSSRRRCSRRRSRRRRSRPTARSSSSTRSWSRWASGACASPPRRRAADGDSLESIVANVTDRRNRSKLYGALDTLEFLKKGGRVGNARALLGSMLAIKPVLEVRDGVVEEAGKVRTRSKALRLLVDRVKEGPFENLAVLHGNAPDLDELLDLLEPLTPRDEIVVGQIGPVIGTHAGPRVIGVTFQAGR